MAILVRGRWGIRRWTASPIGRLVTELNIYFSFYKLALKVTSQVGISIPIIDYNNI
jgi:hypothetical protein